MGCLGWLLLGKVALETVITTTTNGTNDQKKTKKKQKTILRIAFSFYDFIAIGKGTVV